MNEDTKDKGEKNVEITEIESLIIENLQPNDSSDSDDWKKALEREKLKIEIEKIKVDKKKTEVETEELEKPFYKRQAYLQFSIPAIISLLAALVSIYFGFLQNDIKKVQADLDARKSEVARLDAERKELIQAKEKAIQEQEQLDSQIELLKTDKNALNTEKERLGILNASIQSRQDSLNERIEKLRDQKNGLDSEVINLRSEQAKLSLERDKLKNEFEATQNKQYKYVSGKMTKYLDDLLDGDSPTFADYSAIDLFYSNKEFEGQLIQQFQEYLGKATESGGQAQMLLLLIRTARNQQFVLQFRNLIETKLCCGNSTLFWVPSNDKSSVTMIPKFSVLDQKLLRTITNNLNIFFKDDLLHLAQSIKIIANNDGRIKKTEMEQLQTLLETINSELMGKFGTKIDTKFE